MPPDLTVWTLQVGSLWCCVVRDPMPSGVLGVSGFGYAKTEHEAYSLALAARRDKDTLSPAK